MNILYDHQIFSRQKFGGISRYFCELVRAIPALEGDKVEVFAPFHVNEYTNSLGPAIFNGMKLHRFRGAGFVLGMTNAVLARVLVKPRCDVQIFHETYYSKAEFSPKASKRVVTVYDMIHERFPGSFSRRDRTSEYKQHAVRRADHVICISESTRHDLITMFDVPVEKTSVVHLGFALNYMDSFGAPSPNFGKPYLLYVGARGGYKNFEILLRAYAHSKALTGGFALVCFGGGSVTVRERSLLASAGVTDAEVFFMGGDDKLLSSLYSSAAAFIYPSLYEGFGIPPLEAMSHGCPVICTNTSSLPEVAGDAAEFFDPYSQEELQSAIERVVSSPTRTALLVSKGYQRIKRFSWEKCARETLNAYKNLLD